MKNGFFVLFIFFASLVFNQFSIAQENDCLSWLTRNITVSTQPQVKSDCFGQKTTYEYVSVYDDSTGYSYLVLLSRYYNAANQRVLNAEVVGKIEEQRSTDRGKKRVYRYRLVDCESEKTRIILDVVYTLYQP